MIKGIDIAHSFFDGWGLPFLRAEYSHLVDRVASVVCGRSQSLGHDDGLSRDHDWGPQFSLVLTADDMRRYGRWLSQRINAAAPREWDGYHLENGESVEVASLNRWFRRQVNCEYPPKTDRAWYSKTRQDNLCMLKRATVFYDPLGEWTARRQAFSTYPDRVWAWRASDEIYRVWHFGQYNFLDRLTPRRDHVAISIALGTFSEAAMRLTMTLAHEYSPFWKWVAAEFRRLPNVESLDQWLRQLAMTVDLDERVHLVTAICDELHTRVVNHFDLDPAPTNHPQHPLWRARQELLGKFPKTKK
ncbi:MAG: DUF4037 domain-containing protein [Gemmatimonadetes bacterium]|jgi:hypothetical protein|nr:DUF4037 domain-containing protein [Gemmatimonadota bacterium]MBT7913480.1 DUF4037 domain-containing protein [Candidatus Bathyarchaeota archaeon]